MKRIRLGCMIRWEMRGNGARIIGMRIIKVRLLMGVSGREVMRVAGCCVAVRGSAAQTIPVPLAVAGTTQASATAAWVFVWFVGLRGLNLLSFFPFFPFFPFYSFLLLVAVRSTLWPASRAGNFLVFFHNIVMVFEFSCLNQDFGDFRIFRMRFLALSCLNQNLQNFRIFRINFFNLKGYGRGCKPRPAIHIYKITK